MTPTEQDKELREQLVETILSILGVTDRSSGNRPEQIATLEQVIGSYITADRKRVALEARIDEALIADRNLGQYPDYEKMKTASLKRIDDIERGLFISVHDLKAQQEEV